MSQLNIELNECCFWAHTPVPLTLSCISIQVNWRDRVFPAAAAEKPVARDRRLSSFPH